MNKPRLSVACIAVLVGSAGVLAACSSAESGENVETSTSALADHACQTHKALLKGVKALPGEDDDDYDDDGDSTSSSVERGRHHFNNRKLHNLGGGNGRACADCHQQSDEFQLSPASAEARYQALQACKAKKPDADDPLFRPIDADDFRTNGANASNYTNLRTRGLIRITFPLPPNIKLMKTNPMGPPTVSDETEVDVWRAVPPVYNVKLTGDASALPFPLNTPWPRGANVTGGYQLDSRKANLQDQALGALLSHAQAAHAPNNSHFLPDVEAFENQLFSSDGVKNMSSAIDNHLPPVDPDPVLTADEAAGKVVFQRACGQCHGGAGQSNPGAPGIARFGSIQAQCPRPTDTLDPASPIDPLTGQHQPFFGVPEMDFAHGPPHPALRCTVPASQGQAVGALCVNTTLPGPSVADCGDPAVTHSVCGIHFVPSPAAPRWQFAACSQPELPSAPPGWRNTRLYQITRPDGSVVLRPSSDPGRTLLTGFASLQNTPNGLCTVAGGPPPTFTHQEPCIAPPFVLPALDDWQAMDVPQVRNVAHTAPYFHNNSAANLDELLDHYDQFFKFLAAIAPPTGPKLPPLSTDGVNIDRPFTAAERPQLKAYLLKL